MKVYTWDSVGMEWHNSTANVTSMPADPGSFLAKAAAPADDPYDEQVYGLMIGNRYARYGWFGGRGQYFLEILAEDDFKPKPINHDGPIGALADALGTDWLTIVGGHDKFMADMNEIWGEPRNFEIERERGQGKILYTWEHATTVIYNGVPVGKYQPYVVEAFYQAVDSILAQGSPGAAATTAAVEHPPRGTNAARGAL